MSNQKLARVGGLLVALAIAACGDSQPLGIERQELPAEGPRLDVATWNVYVGADLSTLLQVQDATQIPFEVAAVLGRIEATDFPSRAEAIADELAGSRPHVISLQEVSEIRRQSPGDFLAGNPVPATTPVIDYLDVLVDALSSRGLHYTVATATRNFDIELPVVNFSTGGLDDVRLTDYDVILVREDIVFSNPTGGNFQAILPISVGGVTIPKPSGWASVDVSLRENTYRVFNTHLEPADVAPGVLNPGLAQLQAAQAAELMAYMDASPVPVILTGDLNTAADGSTTTTYADLIASGFADTWLDGSDNGPGYTSNQAADLLNQASQLFHRIVFVLYRDESTRRNGTIVGATDSGLLGITRASRTPAGLWPSDHAGLVTRMTLPPGTARP